MTREPEQSIDWSAASDDELPALIEKSRARDRLVLEEKFGPDVRLLAEDDDKLLSYLESKNLSQKRVALLCLLHFHKVYPKRIVREAADYIVDGDDIEIRSWCVSYLGQAYNLEVTSVLRDCAGKLRTREARPGDDVVLRCVDFSLKLLTEGRLPFDYIVGLAEKIVARLNRASERDESAGQAPRLWAGESDQDN